PPTRVNERVQVLHTGSIAATAAPGADDVAHLLRAGASQATISYDPNARPSIMGEPGAVRERVETLVRSADVVKVADEDLIWLYPGQDPMVPARTWANAGPAFVVVTCGGEPAAGLLGDEVVLVPSPQVQVVDTVGARDSYMAALLDALGQADLLGSERREGLHRIGVSRLREAMHRAATAAAITVGRPGADLPTRADLDR